MRRNGQGQARNLAPVAVPVKQKEFESGIKHLRKEEVRSHFPETWLWNLIAAGYVVL